jgi:cytidine deaminase
MNMLDTLILEKNTDGSEEVVIGLVGAIGSNLAVFQNILKTELEDTFNFDVFVIKVSEDILIPHPNVKNVSDFDTSTKYKRINSLMNLGNKLRELHGVDYVALEVACKIRELRKNYSGSKKRIAYVVNSLKHDAEVSSLKKLYGHTFFQISIFESESKRKEILNNNVGMTLDEAEKLIKRDEKEEDKWGQRTSVAFPLADYFVKFDDKSGIHIKNAIIRFIKLILGNPYITPTFSESAIYMAFMSGLRSSDLSRQVGAVIAKEDNILSTGSNDVPKFGGGLYMPLYNEENGKIDDFAKGRDYKIGEDCNHIQRNNLVNGIYESIRKDLEDILSEDIPSQKEVLLKIRDSIKESEIKDITEYGRMVHAEMDAILNCARSNNSTQGATLYVTTFPCHNCAKHIS